MTRIISVVGSVDSTVVNASITAAPGSAGTALAYTNQSSAVTLVNTSASAGFEYKVNTGSWVFVGRGAGMSIAIDLSRDKLYFRQTSNDVTNTTVELSIDAVPNIYATVENANVFAPVASSTTAELIFPNGQKTPVARAVNPYAFQKARKAYANVKMGVANMRVAVICDSTGVGRGAVTDNSYTGARPYCPAEQLAKYLTKLGITANCNSFFGTGVFAANSAQYNAYDSRVSWTGYAPTGAYCMGGNMLLATSAGSFTFQPAAGVNLTDYEVYYVDFGANTSIDIGGAGTVTVPNTNSGTLKKTTITAAASNNPFHANWLTGNSYIAGVIGTNSAVPEVTIVNMCGSGWGATTSPGWASSFAAYSPITSLKLFAPDLTIVRALINDAPNDPVLFKTNMRVLIDAALISGDVMLEISPFTGASVTAGQIAIRKALYELQLEYNCSLNDNTMRWADEATMESLGFFNADKTHMFRVGLSDLATSSLNMILSM